MDDKIKKYSILEELGKASGYDIALMTTYNYEIKFFERAVLNKLYANDVRKISIFVDSKEFTKSLQEADLHDTCYIGSRYMVNPVKLNSSFHPKIVLLLGETKARLFIGSGNIKTSGYTINNEIFNHIDYSSDNPEYLDVIVNAIDFFISINAASYGLDNELLKEAQKYIYYHRCKENGQIRFIHNMNKSILTQLTSLIPEKIDEIKISVPYYDNELAAFKEISSLFPTAKIELYIQNDKTNFPAESYSKLNIMADIKVYEGFIDNKNGNSNNFYHGKVFLFKSETKSYILYGSANCTLAALNKSYNNGGNIECAFFEFGNVNEFDAFFGNFNVIPNAIVKNNPLVHSPVDHTKCSFLYGEEGNGRKLYFSIATNCHISSISLEDIELNYEYKDDILIVTVDEDVAVNLPCIFEVLISTDVECEKHRCWTFNKFILESNRIKQTDRHLFEDFQIESDDNKYMEDRYALLKAELTCLNEYKEYNKKKIHFDQLKQEQEGDDSEDYEYIVEINIPEEYRLAYRQYTAVSNVRNMFIKHFISSNSELSSIIGSNENQPPKASMFMSEKYTIKTRKATSAEKSFERFIKSKVKGMLNPLYVEIIELEHYIGIVEIIFHIFDKYRKEKVEGIFEDEYVLITRVAFLTNIINKNAELTNELELSLLSQCYKTILEIYDNKIKTDDFSLRQKYDSLNRNLLKLLDDKWHIRSDYQNHLIKLGISDSFYSSMLKYMEDLFGYKNWDMLCDLIRNVFSTATIELNGKVLTISTTVDNIHDYGRPNTAVLHEIANYSRCVNPVVSVKIIVNSTVGNVVQIQHFISMTYHDWKTITIRKDGTKLRGKPIFLQF